MFELLSLSTAIYIAILLVAVLAIAIVVYIFLTRETLYSKYPHLARIQTVEVEGDEGPIVMIMANFNFDAPITDEMIAEAIEVFMCQRMLSPPETSGLLVTIVGSLTATQFAEAWIKHGENDEALQAFMTLMHVASAVSASPNGDQSKPEMASLTAG